MSIAHPKDLFSRPFFELSFSKLPGGMTDHRIGPAGTTTGFQYNDNKTPEIGAAQHLEDHDVDMKDHMNYDRVDEVCSFSKAHSLSHSAKISRLYRRMLQIHYL